VHQKLQVTRLNISVVVFGLVSEWQRGLIVTVHGIPKSIGRGH
jgi:hypothetical protein